MLKETSHSLRLYFGIVAAFSLFSGAMAIYQAGSAPIVLVLSSVSIVFGLLFAYIVIRFSELLTKRPAFIRNVLAGNLALSVIGFLLSLSVGIQPAALFRLGIAVLIYFYLVKSVNRLSAEGSLKNA